MWSVKPSEFAATDNIYELVAIKASGLRLSAARHYRFSDGEIGLSIDESVRGADVFVVQPTSSPTNDNLFELLIMIDAFKRASASRINVVTPYFGYARQDRKSKPREPITEIGRAHV